MKRVILLVCVALLCAMGVHAQCLQSLQLPTEEGTQFWFADPTIGLAYDLGDDPGGLGLYISVPWVQSEDGTWRMNLGMYMPLESDHEKLQPYISSGMLFGELFWPEFDWIPLEVSGFIALSEYMGWGIQFGLLRMAW